MITTQVKFKGLVQELYKTASLTTTLSTSLPNICRVRTCLDFVVKATIQGSLTRKVRCGAVEGAVTDMTRMYWPEIGLLPSETVTTKERKSVNEYGIERCSYLRRYMRKEVTIKIKQEVIMEKMKC